MDDILKKLCDEYGVEPEIIKKIIDIEKDNVHKKTRHGIFGDLRYIIEQHVKDGDNNDNK